MNYRQKFTLFVLVLFSLSGSTSLAQGFSSFEEAQGAYEGLDKTIGIQNTEIFTGIEYIEKHRMINEKNKFFEQDIFTLGTVFYEGQPYFKIPIKYNVFDDLLLVQLESERGGAIFRLLPNKLNGFILNSKRFVNVWEEENNFSGIYQLLYETSRIQVLKEYNMSMNKVSSRQLLHVHYEFELNKPQFYFSFDGTYYKLSRKSLLDLFPNHKPEVRDAYRNFRKRRGEQRENALVAMFQTIAELSNDYPQ